MWFEVERWDNDRSVPIMIHWERVARVEVPVNITGFGGVGIGKNNTRIVFLDSTILLVDSNTTPDRLERALTDPGFSGKIMKTRSETSDVYLNIEHINYILDNSPDDSKFGPHRAYSPNGHQVSLPRFPGEEESEPEGPSPDALPGL